MVAGKTYVFDFIYNFSFIFIIPKEYFIVLYLPNIFVHLFVYIFCRYTRFKNFTRQLIDVQKQIKTYCIVATI